MGEGESSPARLRVQPLWKLQTMGLAVPSPVGRERVRVRVKLFELRLLFGTCFCTNPYFAGRAAGFRANDPFAAAARWPACQIANEPRSLESVSAVGRSDKAPGKSPRRLPTRTSRSAMSSGRFSCEARSAAGRPVAA